MELILWLLLIGFLTLVYVIWCVFHRLTIGMCYSTKDMSGKTVIITGANTGIGYYTALDLATRNAHVILACRRVIQGEDACRLIRQETGNDKVFFKQLDLSAMSSVQRFATEIIQEEQQLHVLINNAACHSLPFCLTEDGLEKNMATNHFGPFLLTNLLLDLMKKSAPSRIINVASAVHHVGHIDINNLNGEKKFQRHRIYPNTKLANVLFTRELSRQLEGSGVTANSLHPGAVYTELHRALPSILRLVIDAFVRSFCKTAEQGAQTTIYCAVSEELEGVTGCYFSDCAKTRISKTARDDGLARKLWEISEKYTKL